MRRLFVTTIMAVCVATLCFTGTAAAAPIKISYVSFVDKNHLMMVNMQDVFAEIEKRSDGRLEFDFKGGPEAIKMFAQTLAVYKGATDMVFTSPSFMGKLIKGTEMLTMNELPVSKQRDAGLDKYLNEVFNKKNMEYLFMYPREAGTAYAMVTKKKITSVEDFKGLSTRGGDWMDVVGPKLGMSTVAMKHFEEYSGLERGLIDVGRMTIDSMYKFKLNEVAQYMIEPPFATAPSIFLMNKRKWDSIPKDLQDIILNTFYEMADQVEQKTTAQITEMKNKMIASGMEIVELKGEEKEKFISAIKSGMKEYFSKDNPEVANKIYEIVH